MADQVYDGFISYSHAADGLLAPRLQAGLQRFAKPWWKRRAFRVELDVLVDVAVTRLTRSFTTQECVTYRIDPCPTLEELRGS